MDGEWVSGLLSENGDGGGNAPVANLTYTEIFNKVLPYYLSIGMSAEEFWHGEAELVIAYRQAHKLRRKEANFNCWLQGRYIYDALLCASPLLRTNFTKGKVTAYDYVEQYNLDEEDRAIAEEKKEQKQQQKLFKRMQDKMASINKKFKK